MSVYRGLKYEYLVKMLLFIPPSRMYFLCVLLDIYKYQQSAISNCTLH